MKTKSHFKKSCGMLYLCILIITLTGCASIIENSVPERSSDSGDELEALKSYFEENVIKIYQNEEEADKKKAYRNEVIFARTRAVDLHYNDFIQTLYKGSKLTGIRADTLSLLLGGFGVVSTVASTKSIFVAADTVVKGVKTSIDKNSYYDSTLNALIAQMNATRQTILVDIYTGIDQDIAQYPLLRGLIEVEKYFQAGTIANAVSEINESAGKTKSEADIAMKGLSTKNQKEKE